jgi:hypothetical protein
MSIKAVMLMVPAFAGHAHRIISPFM